MKDIILDILPKKIKPHTMASENADDYEIACDNYNQAIDDCHAALSQAVKDGVVCGVPSEDEVRKKIYNHEFIGGLGTESPILILPSQLSKAILNLLKQGTTE